MKKTFLLLFFLIPGFLCAQPGEKDIPSAIQNKIAAAEKETDSKKQLGAALQLLRWGKENDNSCVKAKAYQLIASVYRPQRGQQLFEADSVFQFYAAACNNNMLHFEALKFYITDLLNDNIVSRAKSLLTVMDTVTGRFASPYQLCVLNQLKAFYYLKKFDPKTALAFFHQSVAYADSADNAFLKARSFSQMSMCYSLRMNTDSASWYLLQALAIHEKSGDFYEMASDYNGLAMLFRFSSNKEKALSNFVKAITCYQKANAPIEEGYTNLQLGEMYIGWKQPNDAYPHLQNAQTTFERLDYKNGLSLTYSLLARYYAQINNKDSADAFSARAKTMTGHGNALTGLYVAGQRIAKEIEVGNYQQSDSLLKIALPQAIGLLPKELVNKAIDKARAGSDSAHFFSAKEFTSGSSTINSATAAAAVINPFSGFPNRQDSLISSLIQQNQQLTEGVDSLRRQVVKDSLHDANRQLALKEKELTIKNLILTIASVALLAAVFIAFNTFLSNRKISREKKYTLHYAKGNLSIINANIADIGRASTAKKDFELLKQKIFPLNSLYQLLEEKLTDRIFMTDYLTDICTNLSKAYSLNRNIALHVDAPVYLQGKKAQTVGFIVNEVVTNSFKHAFSEINSGEINVTCKKNQGGFELKIFDNGKGFDDATRTKGQGTELVQGLAQELSAIVKKSSTNGTTLEFYFF